MTMPVRREARSLPEAIREFNDRVVGLVLSHGDFPGRQLQEAVRNGILLPWQDYVARLGHHSVEARPDSHLSETWWDLYEWAKAAQRARERELVAVPADELSATTVVEFVALLNKLRQRAPGGVAGLRKRSGISRSQIYRISDVRKPVLPTRSDQVRAFLEACGLPESQVSQVEQIWADLNENRSEDATLPGEQKLLGVLHRMMIELYWMTGKDRRRRMQEASHSLAIDIVNQLEADNLRDPKMVAMVLEDVALALRTRVAYSGMRQKTLRLTDDWDEDKPFGPYEVEGRGRPRPSTLDQRMESGLESA